MGVAGARLAHNEDDFFRGKRRSEKAGLAFFGFFVRQGRRNKIFAKGEKQSPVSHCEFKLQGARHAKAGPVSDRSRKCEEARITPARGRRRRQAMVEFPANGEINNDDS